MTDKDRIRHFIIENFYVDDDGDLPDEASLLDRGIVDSTGILDLIAFLEDQWSIRVSDEEMIPEHFDSVEGIAAFLERRRSAAA